MNQRSRALVASAAIVGIFLVVQLGALALVQPFTDAGYQPDVEHEDPTNSLVYVVAILVVTAAMLGGIKYDLDLAIRGFMVFAGAWISMYVFQMALPAVDSLPTVGGFHALAVLAATALGIVLWVYPEWYVIDAAGVLMGIGAAGLFGITFGILPALVLLVALAVYDAISVYGTEHMLALASGVMEMRVPVVLVIPLTLSYSFLDADLPDPAGEADAADEGADPDDPPSPAGTESPRAEGTAATAVPDGDGQPATDDHQSADGDARADEADPLDREALFIGLGDAIIPAVLVASAGFFLTEVPTVALVGLEVTVPALTAMVGTIAGLLVLLRMVLAGRAHAGLPLLNGGAIAGYLAGALASGLTLTQALGLGSVL